MPIYEYACKSCEHRMTALQKMSDDALVDCPECGKPALKRLISAPRFRLKGGGWYETDFKKDNQRNIAKSDSESGSKGKSTDSGSSDSGTAKKSAESSSTGGSSSSTGNNKEAS